VTAVSCGCGDRAVNLPACFDLLEVASILRLLNAVKHVPTI